MVVAIDCEKSRKSLSALIIALIATKKVIITRFVGREKASPKLVVLLSINLRVINVFEWFPCQLLKPLDISNSLL